MDERYSPFRLSGRADANVYIDLQDMSNNNRDGNASVTPTGNGVGAPSGDISATAPSAGTGGGGGSGDSVTSTTVSGEASATNSISSFGGTFGAPSVSTMNTDVPTEDEGEDLFDEDVLPSPMRRSGSRGLVDGDTSFANVSVAANPVFTVSTAAPTPSVAEEAARQRASAPAYVGIHSTSESNPTSPNSSSTATPHHHGGRSRHSSFIPPRGHSPSTTSSNNGFLSPTSPSRPGDARQRPHSPSRLAQRAHSPSMAYLSSR